MMKLNEVVTKTEFSRDSNTSRGEWSGPCPFCQGGDGWVGDDRMCVWPEHPVGTGGRFWCRKCEIQGDGIDFLMEMEGVEFHEAKERVDGALSDGKNIRRRSFDVPGAWWRKRVHWLLKEAREALMDGAVSYLQDRGLTEETIDRYGLGFIGDSRIEEWPVYSTRRRKRANQQNVSTREVHIPAGIVIPYFVDGSVVKVNCRTEEGYQLIKGSANALFGVNFIGQRVVVTEGEIDAMLIDQEVDDCTAVATGGAKGARCERWVEALNNAQEVVLGFDDDEAGEEAARWWGKRLDRSRRVVPYFGDVNEMYDCGVDLNQWV